MGVHVKKSWRIGLTAQKHEPTVYFSAKYANVTLGWIARNRCSGQGKR